MGELVSKEGGDHRGDEAVILDTLRQACPPDYLEDLVAKDGFKDVFSNHEDLEVSPPETVDEMDETIANLIGDKERDYMPLVKALCVYFEKDCETPPPM